MSPRPAALSSASHSAWAATSPSECPAQPSAPSNSSPSSQHGLPASIGWTSVPMPTLRHAHVARPSRASASSRSVGVVILKASGSPSTTCTWRAGHLDHRGVVGEPARGRAFVGAAQQLGLESLRGLHGAQARPLRGAEHDAVGVDGLDGVADRQPGHHRGMTGVRACTTRTISAGGVSALAASWTRTNSASPTAASASRTDSVRSVPPATMTASPPKTSLASSVRFGGTATTTLSTTPESRRPRGHAPASGDRPD